MNAEKPRRKETDIYCPFWKRPVCKVCHTCEFYGKLIGTDPQTGKEIEEWGCSVGFLPKLLLENSQQSRQAGASTDKVATEVEKLRQGVMQAGRAIASAASTPPRQTKIIDASDN